MSKTSSEVCTEALRLLGVVAVDEPPSADDYARAKDHMDDIFSTLTDTYALALDWTVETVPDGAFLPFARAIAGSIASAYGREQTAASAAAMINPRRTLYQNGLDGIRHYEARAMHHENHTTKATFY